MNWLVFYTSASLILIAVCRSENDGANPRNSVSATTNIQNPPAHKLVESSYWCNDQHEDFVRSIPGYVPVVPPTCWYSGYVSYEISGTLIHTHYTLQTAEFLSEDSTRANGDVKSPFVKPLIYWSSYVCIQFTTFCYAFLESPLANLIVFFTLQMEVLVLVVCLDC